jgi:hypothetical protein
MSALGNKAIKFMIFSELMKMHKITNIKLFKPF